MEESYGLLIRSRDSSDLSLPSIMIPDFTPSPIPTCDYRIAFREILTPIIMGTAFLVLGFDHSWSSILASRRVFKDRSIFFQPFKLSPKDGVLCGLFRLSTLSNVSSHPSGVMYSSLLACVFVSFVFYSYSPYRDPWLLLSSPGPNNGTTRSPWRYSITLNLVFRNFSILNLNFSCMVDS
jgi:hypothetical protein